MSRSAPLPNFLIIGVPRAGTTTLYEGLSEHPEVYTSPFKEPWFFALEGRSEPFHGPGDDHAVRRGVRDLSAYRELFGRVRGEKAVGEASTLYLYSVEAPRRIERYIPGAKLIAVLRNPVDRAYSNYLQHVQQGREPLGDFGAALDAERERMRLDWSPFWFYREMGFYAGQLSRYVHRFGWEQVRVFLYEDLRRDPAGVFKAAFDFLGVEENYAPDLSVRHNVSGVPRSRALHAFLARSNPIKSAVKPFLPRRLRKRLLAGFEKSNLRRAAGLSPEIRRDLVEVYRKDVLELQELIGRDLSGWLE